MKEQTNILQRWSGPKRRQDRTSRTRWRVEPVRSFSLWLLMAALAMAASPVPARATTQTALPNKRPENAVLSAVNCGATPVRTQHLDRPDQVPDGLSPS